MSPTIFSSSMIMMLYLSMPYLLIVASGQFDGKCRADPHLALDPDLPLVVFNDAVAYRKSQARPPLALGAEKGIEDVRKVLGRDPPSRVNDRYLHGLPALPGPRGDEKPSARGHGLDGIRDQVDEHLLDLVLVDVQGGQAVFEIDPGFDIRHVDHVLDQ